MHTLDDPLSGRVDRQGDLAASIGTRGYLRARILFTERDDEGSLERLPAIQKAKRVSLPAPHAGVTERNEFQSQSMAFGHEPLRRGVGFPNDRFRCAREHFLSELAALPSFSSFSRDSLEPLLAKIALELRRLDLNSGSTASVQENCTLARPRRNRSCRGLSVATDDLRFASGVDERETFDSRFIPRDGVTNEILSDSERHGRRFRSGELPGRRVEPEVMREPHGGEEEKASQSTEEDRHLHAYVSWQMLDSRGIESLFPTLKNIMRKLLPLILRTSMVAMAIAGCRAAADKIETPSALAPTAAAAPAPSGRIPAKVMSSHGADWLDRPSREAEDQPEKVIDAMKLSPDNIVAEIGTGTGYFARRIARRLSPAGKIYANDIQPEMLELLRQRASAEGVSNIVTVLGKENDPLLPDGTLDWILLVDVYHEFQNPQPMLAAMHRDLGPTGRVALVEYRLEGETASHIREEHRMSVEQVLKEWEPAGFELVERLEFLPSQHLFIFRKMK